MKWATTLAVATAAVCLASAQSTCMYPWFEMIGDTCYYFVEVKKTWAAMWAHCQEFYGDLARLDEKQHALIIEHIKAQGPGAYDDEAFWIGGSDAASEGNWKWVKDDEDISLYSPSWYPGQPNGGTQQNFLALYTPDFYFHSLEGSREIWGICKL